MGSVAFLTVLLTANIDIGGNAGIAMPALTLARYHASAATVGAQVGWAWQRVHLELGYSYAGLSGRAQGTYYLTMHTLSLCTNWEVLQQRSWGLELTLGGGAGFAQRTLDKALETGKTPCLLTGLGFVQREGRSRFRFAFSNGIFIQTPGGRPYLSWMPQLRAYISYVL